MADDIDKVHIEGEKIGISRSEDGDTDTGGPNNDTEREEESKTVRTDEVDILAKIEDEIRNAIKSTQ